MRLRERERKRERERTKIEHREKTERKQRERERGAGRAPLAPRDGEQRDPLGYSVTRLGFRLRRRGQGKRPRCRAWDLAFRL